MYFFLTLGIVETKPNPKVDLIKKELAGEISIKRKATSEGQFVFAEPVEVFGYVAIDLGIGGGVGDSVYRSIGYGVDDVGGRHGDKHIDDAYENLFKVRIDHDDGHTTSFGPSSISCSYYKFQEYEKEVKDKDEDESDNEDEKRLGIQIQQQVKDYANKVVHPWLVPTYQELKMPFFLTLDFGIGNGVGDGVSGDVGDGVDDAGVRHGDENIDDAHENLLEKRVEHDDCHTSGGYSGFTTFSGHTTSFGPSSNSCSSCEFQECKDRHENLIKNIDALTIVFKKLTSKRGVIPSVKDYSNEVSHPRILRWFSIKNNSKMNPLDIFSPYDDASINLKETKFHFISELTVSDSPDILKSEELSEFFTEIGIGGFIRRKNGSSPSLETYEQEFEIPFFLTQGIFETKLDQKLDLIKKELDEETSIKREPAKKGQFVRSNPVEMYGDISINLGIGGGVSDGIGSGDGFDDVISRHGNEHVGNVLMKICSKIELTMMMVILVVAMVDSPLSVNVQPLLVPL
ncbi:hypothetical protein FXO37_32602 [Capsicum annuum]|nr:hypothetical protein FXO37_32602 [Capsicum annuum]